MHGQQNIKKTQNHIHWWLEPSVQNTASYSAAAFYYNTQRIAEAKKNSLNCVIIEYIQMTSVYGQSLPVLKEQQNTAPDYAVGTDIEQCAEGWFPLQNTFQPISVNTPRYKTTLSPYHPCVKDVLREMSTRNLLISLRSFATIKCNLYSLHSDCMTLHPLHHTSHATHTSCPTPDMLHAAPKKLTVIC
jgi:hypothetical protein